LLERVSAHGQQTEICPKIGYRLLMPVSLETFDERNFGIRQFQPAFAPPTAQAVSMNFPFLFASLFAALVFLAVLAFFILSRHQTGNFHIHYDCVTF